jgi:putative CocE/NonD family hydrolase
MQQHFDVEMRLNVNVPMRDGVNLSADIYLPKASGPFPTVLIRTPYSNNTDDSIKQDRRLANEGYACVIQDVRGRWDSKGDYYPFIYEADDGYDTQEWVGRQPFCNGRIGMSGGSYLACVQWLSAPLRSEFLTCLAPRVMCNDYFKDLLYPGGAFQLNVAITWGMRTRARTAQSIDFHNWTEAFRTLPLSEMATQVGEDVPFWKDWIEHSTDDEYWDAINVERKFHEIAVPALEMGGWYDLYSSNSFTNWSGLRDRGSTPERCKREMVGSPCPMDLDLA